jgi:cytochrome c biogenesis protein CcdA/glutaredoxin
MTEQSFLVKHITKIFVVLWVITGIFALYSLSQPEETTIITDTAQSASSSATVHFFGRDDCSFCSKEKAFLADLPEAYASTTVIYYNITADAAAGELYTTLTSANNIARITPITFVGGKIIQGFEAPETTGQLILEGIDAARVGNDFAIEEYENIDEIIASGQGCTDDGTHETCAVDVGTQERFSMKLPFVGVVELDSLPLATLSVALGVIDGFNPCAMWVLVTFLLILMQIGSRKRMIQIAGLFLLAEAIMYYLILMVWFTAWDFIGLDQIVTPLIGMVALGGGFFFLQKYAKDNGKLICDVTDLEKQGKIEKKISELAQSPLTWATSLGVIGVAFSVNVIEFACSIGIPQAFTKIIELNALSTAMEQVYILLFMLAYMIDDIIIFLIAMYSFDKLHQSHKYSKYSSLIGGILMIGLGLLLLFAPDVLVFG